MLISPNLPPIIIELLASNVSPIRDEYELRVKVFPSSNLSFLSNIIQFVALIGSYFFADVPAVCLKL